MTAQDWRHKQWARKHPSDIDVMAEIRRLHLRRDARGGNTRHEWVRLSRAVIFGLCIAATLFLIFKTLYSPAANPAKPFPASISKTP